MGGIVDIQVARVQKLLAYRKVTLDLTDAARAWLGRVGYDPVYGARPLKRAVQKYLQDPLADLILKGEVKDGQAIKVDEGDGALVLTAACAASRAFRFTAAGSATAPADPGVPAERSTRGRAFPSNRERPDCPCRRSFSIRHWC